MKNKLIYSIIGIFSFAGIAYAQTAGIPITVPSAPGAGYCLQSIASGRYNYYTPCASGGGGAGTFSTTTLYGNLWQYPYQLLGTSLGGSATTSSAIWFDPFVNKSVLGGNATAGVFTGTSTSAASMFPNVTVTKQLDIQGNAQLGSSTLIQFMNNVNPAAGGVAADVGIDRYNTNTLEVNNGTQDQQGNLLANNLTAIGSLNVGSSSQFQVNSQGYVQSPIYPTTYLMTVFSDSDQHGAKAFTSTDGFNINPLLSSTGGDLLTDSIAYRDGRITKIGSTYYWMYTANESNSGYGAGQYSIGLASSSDLINWKKITTPNWSAEFTGSENSVFIGDMFYDTPNNQWYMTFGTSDWAGHVDPWIVTWNPYAMTWGAPVVQTYNPSNDTSMLMASIWVQNGAYYAALQSHGNDMAGNAYIEFASSSSMTGTWSIYDNNNAAGFSSIQPMEAPDHITLPNNVQAVYFTNFGGGSVFYATSSDSVTWNFNQMKDVVGSFTSADWVNIVPFNDSQTDQAIGAIRNGMVPSDFATTSANYWISKYGNGNLFSTTSANYWLTQNQGNSFSTTSAAYWASQNSVTSLTTTGSSGAATLTGGVLNIPNYSVGAGGSGGTFSTTSPYNLAIVQYPYTSLFTSLDSSATSTSGWWYDPTTTTSHSIYASSTVLSIGGITAKAYDTKSFTIATTSAWTGTTTARIFDITSGEVFSSAACATDVGTVNVDIYYSSTHLNMLMASTTIGIQGITTNGSPASKSVMYVDAGTPGSSPTEVNCTLKMYWPDGVLW